VDPEARAIRTTDERPTRSKSLEDAEGRCSRIAATGSGCAQEDRRRGPISASRGTYTEWLVLDAVATHYEGKVLWDAAKLEITNN
jgi:hypothetical protein